MSAIPMLETADERIAKNRRKVAEYRIWGQGLRGTLLLLVQVVGTVWGAIFTQVASMVLLSAVCAFVHNNFYAFDVELSGHQIVMTPMSFLLVFRCSNSYGRYWDGRTLLGGMVFHCREIVAKACCYSPNDNCGELFVQNVKRYTMVTAKLINRTVSQHWDKVAADREKRKKKGDGWKWGFRDLVTYLTVPEYDDLKCVERNHPLLALQWLRQEVLNAHVLQVLSPLQEQEISSSVGELQLVWNGMAKITATPLPFPWLHVSRMILYVFLVTLVPPAVTKLNWVAVPFILVLSFLLFGLVRIGDEMEDPFGNDINDFDLLAIEKTIEGDLQLLDMLREKRFKKSDKRMPV
ncbi:UPF0187 protein [Diplonema papillatum]|nr:UPF0187 protein [Diplonema papillatum]